MKKLIFILSLLFSLFIIYTCSDDNSTNPQTEESTGTLLFETSNSFNNYFLDKGLRLSNPPLTGDTTATYTTSLLFCIGDVWVSQGIVKEGLPDNLEWIRITGETNYELKLFENYYFTEVSIPLGTYKSIKITFKNVFYRYAKLISNPSVTYELLETMGSWTDPCDSNDQSWAPTNYFGPDGNHVLNDQNLFEMVAPGEKIDGFEIKSDRKAVVTWRFGAGALTPCTTYLIDMNGNREWDCGIDVMEFDCPPEVKYMWDFVVKYL